MSTSSEEDCKNQTPGHYCWIRVVDVYKNARRNRSRLMAVPNPWTKADNRPPPKIKGSSIYRSNITEAWTAVEELMGRDNATTVFEYGPAFVLQCEAEAWITTPEGQAWDEDAENRMLISFIGDLGKHDTLKEPDPVTGTDDKITEFPDIAWDPVLRHLWAGHAAAQQKFLGKTVELFPTNDYLNERPDVIYGPEAGDVSSDAAKSAYQEAHGAARVMAELFSVVDLDLDKPPVALAMKQARTRLMNAVESVVYPLKAHHKRPRPWMVFPELMRMFGDDDWRLPRHPSYPAGHAVTAGMWAELLAAKYPARRKKLVERGEEIAKRRMAAGLHFQSDITDGLALGRSLAGIVLGQLRGSTQDIELAEFKAFWDQWT